MIRQVLVLVGFLAAWPAVAQDLPATNGAPQSEFSSSASEPAAVPDGLSDAELELIVRAAYTAASAFAVTHGNYFARDGVFPPLRDAVAVGVAKDFAAVTVPATPAADVDAARVCSAPTTTELRIATNTYGDGVSLVAVTAERAFAYDYDPHKSPDIAIVAASDCTKLQ